jgi:glutathione synthase/RimK-type ligase-like ATP-grasp enzyme
MEVLLLTEPKHPPRTGPPSARYQVGRGNVLAEALVLAGHRPVLWWDHPVGPMVDAAPGLVLLRSGLEVQLDRADQLAAAGVRVVNDPKAHRRARDKLEQALAFWSAGVPHPSTLGVGDGIVDPGSPLVAKPRQGSSGLGVRLVAGRDVDAAVAVGDLVQARVVDATEYRVTVVGGDDVAWARKIPAEGEFRGNLDLGARMVPAERPGGDAARVACAAVEALGLDIGGVDLMLGRSGPVVLEVNAATTLHGADGDQTQRILGSVVGLCRAVVDGC